MQDWQSLSHVRWECKYHVVVIPKYRQKVFYGKMRRRIGANLRDLGCIPKRGANPRTGGLRIFWLLLRDRPIAPAFPLLSSAS